MGRFRGRTNGGERYSGPHERAPIGVYLVLLGRRLSCMIGRQLVSLGVNRTQGMIVLALRALPGLMVLDLADPIWIEPPSVTRAVQALERRGLVVRHPHPTDGRASLFYQTPAGETMAGVIDRVTGRTSDLIEVGLSPEQRLALRESLEVLAGRMDALWADDSGEQACVPDPRAAAVGRVTSKGSDS